MKAKNRLLLSSIPEGLVVPEGAGLLLERAGEDSGDRLCFSAVRTEERAATAAALCDP